jgi:hypothetical protein
MSQLLYMALYEVFSAAYGFEGCSITMLSPSWFVSAALIACIYL